MVCDRVASVKGLGRYVRSFTRVVEYDASGPAPDIVPLSVGNIGGLPKPLKRAPYQGERDTPEPFL